MPKVKISEYSATANSNTDVASINIDEGCAPSGINNAIRAVMGHLKDFQQGTNGDPFNGPVNGTLGATTASTASVTTLTTSSTVTHNGGTANGVAYLNGSKVLTTGSALTFDGATLTSTSTSANQLVLTGGTTVNTRLKMIRGTDDATQFLMAGWNGLVMERTGAAVSAVQDFTITMRGTTDVVPISVNSTGLAVTGLTDISAATSGQIKFPATQNASANANTLDDYEEGTFTPTAVGSTTAGTGTYGTRTGVYTKIGRFVHVYISIDWSAHTGTGNLRISGLPFSAQQNEVANMFANGLTYTGTHLQPFLVGTEVWLVQTSSGAADTYIPMDTNCQLGFTIVYYV